MNIISIIERKVLSLMALVNFPKKIKILKRFKKLKEITYNNKMSNKTFSKWCKILTVYLIKTATC